MSPVSQRGESTDESMSLEDVLCPVCLEIFMEPVTLPCTHTFCKGCFLESVDKATLCCPLCRKRVSTWARLHTRNQTLVDQTLWTRIQARFPLQCQRRLSGQEGDETERPAVAPRVSPPGELRQEYEDQVTRLREEQQVLDEEEQRASEQLIQKLLQEEDQLLQEERRRRDTDEQLARLLSDQLNSAPVCHQKMEMKKKKKKKKEEATTGQIERFLSPRAPQICSNKENVLLPGAEPDLPRLDYCGPQMEEVHLGSPRGCLLPSSAKRKSSELEAAEEQEGLTQQLLSQPSSGEPGTAAWEVELQQRRQHQEEEDRQLAVLLQKELDEEERRRATDRRKGSCDAYLLRHKKGGAEEVGSSRSPSSCRRASSTKALKTPCSPSPSSSSDPSSSRGSKQMTLTKMFSGLSS